MKPVCARRTPLYPILLNLLTMKTAGGNSKHKYRNFNQYMNILIFQPNKLNHILTSIFYENLL